MEITELVIFLTRSATIILSMLIGAMCIFFSWKLQLESTKQRKTQVSIESKSFKMSILTSAPEIIFFVFGAALVLIPLTFQVSYEEKIEDGRAVNFENGVNRPPSFLASYSEMPLKNPSDKKVENQALDDCVYRKKSRKIRWFDRDEIESEKTRLREAILTVIPVIESEISKTPEDRNLQEAYIVLIEVKEGVGE